MSPWQVVARGGAVAGTALTTLATLMVTTNSTAPIVIALLAAGAAAAAVLPDSHAPSALLVLIVWVWVVQTDADVSTVRTPWTLVAAIGVACLHAGPALVAGTPPGARLDPVLARRWAMRFGITIAATAAVWGVAVALTYVDSVPNAAIAAAALAVVAGAGLVLWRSLQPD